MTQRTQHSLSVHTAGFEVCAPACFHIGFGVCGDLCVMELTGEVFVQSASANGLCTSLGASLVSSPVGLSHEPHTALEVRLFGISFKFLLTLRVSLYSHK